jgi:hypothetical protein
LEELIVGEESLLNHPMNLTALYRKFYRADKQYNPKANAVLKPIDIASKTILEADPSFQGQALLPGFDETDVSFHGKALVALVAAEISKLMDRVHARTAEGRPVFKRNQREEERQAILDFASYFVEKVFEESFASDRARLAGRQINLIRDTCEFLYRLENDKENRARKLTQLYRKFYRANDQYNLEADAILKPLNIASQTILESEQNLHSKALVSAVVTEILKLMDRVHTSTAEGRWMFKNREEEQQAIVEFARYFVVEVFEKSFAGDRARLAGRQINLIRDTCEFIYRLEDDKENRVKKEQEEDTNLTGEEDES